MSTFFIKDPDATLDFAFDWSAWLATGETIADHTITAQAGITVESSSEAAGVVTVWLSGGTAVTVYTVACEVTTSAGRVDERTISVQVVQR